MSELLIIYLVFVLSLAPLFFVFAWCESENYTYNQRRVLAALTLFAPVTAWFVPFAAAAYCLFLLCRGIAKLIGIVAGEE
jgi:hypothetical protein